MLVSHFYRKADLHTLPRTQKDLKEKCSQIEVTASEWCYNVEHTCQLTEDDIQKLTYLFSETFEPEAFSTTSSFLTKCSLPIVEVGPRQQFTSAWSTNAVGICQHLGLNKITRVERSKR